MENIEKETIDALSCKPILTTDMGIVKAYQDSLFAYDAYKKLKEHYVNLVKDLDFDEGRELEKEFLNKQQVFNKYFKKDEDGQYISESNNIGQKGAWFHTYVVYKPVQPYLYDFEKQQMDRVLPIELEDKKRWLDIAEQRSKKAQSKYFELEKEREMLIKENPLLKIGQNAVDKIKPENL